MATPEPTTDPFQVYKECRRCLEVKDVSEFYQEKSGQRRHNCKTCCKEQSKASRERLKAQHALTPFTPQWPKRCRKCLEIKDASEFYLRDTGSLFGRCKTCVKQDVMTYQAEHRDEKLTYNHVYYLENCEKLVQDARAYRAANPEKVREGNRKAYLKNPERYKADATRRIFLLRNTLYVEDVKIDVLFARDKGICGICHKIVKRADASRDHIIPVSYGGEHSYKNTQLAHLRCNKRRGNRRTIPVQMRLLG